MDTDKYILLEPFRRYPVNADKSPAVAFVGNSEGYKDIKLIQER